MLPIQIPYLYASASSRLATLPSEYCSYPLLTLPDDTVYQMFQLESFNSSLKSFQPQAHHLSMDLSKYCLIFSFLSFQMPLILTQFNLLTSCFFSLTSSIPHLVLFYTMTFITYFLYFSAHPLSWCFTSLCF